MRRNGLLLIIFVLLMVAITLMIWKPWVVQAETSVSDISAAWAESGHGDYTSESFNHWNEEESGTIPPTCAKCHSGFGMRDYLGLDGSEAGRMDAAARLGSVVSCETCHNPAADAITEVKFPSGEVVPAMGSSSMCLNCHSGMGSGVGTATKIEGMDLDTVSEDLASMNPHYLAAGATLFGTEAKGGYEYEGMTYAGKFEHSANAQTCVDCHDPHTLEVDEENCQACHSNVVDAEDFVDVRMTKADLDGDGDTTEGIAKELDGMREVLVKALWMYSDEVLDNPILFAPDTYPYFFADTNGNGAADEGEAVFPNQYKGWSPRLVRTTYNLLFSVKDHGAYAHNPTYVAQLMYDSIADLSEVISQDLTAGLTRP